MAQFTQFTMDITKQIKTALAGTPIPETLSPQMPGFVSESTWRVEEITTWGGSSADCAQAFDSPVLA